MSVRLYDHQLEALKKMKNGCILCGGVGSGKSITSLAYYFTREGGKIDSDNFSPMKNKPKDLYIITTARKRDTLEWEAEMPPFLMSTNPEVSFYEHRVVVDSWNNIKKYKNISDSFFIFDEQRVIGTGVWVRSFLSIAKKNNWILLSATPGDSWKDYIPVFIANGFYRSRREFEFQHVQYNRYSKFPMIDRYVDTNVLNRHRNSILIKMEFERHTISHHEDIVVPYDRDLYKQITRNRWNPYINKPIPNAASLCYVWRKVVNSDASREIETLKLFKKHPKLIIFYNFNYELEILRNLNYGKGVKVAEWNGHKHEEIPSSKKWVYLVQYNSGSEGWNCTDTDAIIFYSQNYSYKTMHQAAGRIDRLNTPFTDLYYYHIKSKAPIDLAILKAIKEKKNFNANLFVKW